MRGGGHTIIIHFMQIASVAVEIGMSSLPGMEVICLLSDHKSFFSEANRVEGDVVLRMLYSLEFDVNRDVSVCGC